MKKFKALSSIILIISILTMFSTSTLKAYAPENSMMPLYDQLVFVIDCSNSMNENDSDKLANEMIRMFVDASNSKNTEVGFVAFNDKIIKTYDITGLDDDAIRNEIKTEVGSLKPTGSTDVGMAINCGMDMLLENAKGNSRSAMILFSDGETDLRYTRTGRTYEDSLADENAAYEKAKQINCPIYPVGLSKSGRLNTDYLDEIAKNTNAEKHMIQNTDDLFKVFNILFSKAMNIDMTTYDLVTTDASDRHVTVTLPSKYVNEANIIIEHTAPITNITADLSAPVSVYNSKKYTSIKIIDPESDNVGISFNSKEDNALSIKVINHIDIRPKVEMPINLSGSKVSIKAQLYNVYSEAVINDASVYSGVKADAIITNVTTGEVMQLPMENTGKEFALIYDNNEPKALDFKVVVTGDGYSNVSPVQAITFSNTPPKQIGFDEIILLKQSKESKYNLNDYFTDEDGDELHFTASDSEDTFGFNISGNLLSIIPQKSGDYSLSIKANDGRSGITTGEVNVNIQPFWVYYKTPIAIIGSIFLLLTAAYVMYRLLLKKKEVKQVTTYYTEAQNVPKFYGARFEGYFLSTKSGNEIPVLNWNASYIENKYIVSLGELLSMMDVKEKLPEAHKIYFEAGGKGVLIFHHSTNCQISIERKDVPSNKKETLSYDDRIYIMFEDGETEIEIRYKRSRRMATA